MKTYFKCLGAVEAGSIGVPLFHYSHSPLLALAVSGGGGVALAGRRKP